jgi:hypothetical protein
MVVPRPLIDFAIVGGQRAGSSHLSALLARHPDLYVVPDEVPYFEDPFFGRSDPVELIRALAPASRHQQRGIHRPELLSRPECAPRLADANPRVRLLAALRNPVDRAISAHAWYAQFGLVPLEPAAAGIARLLEGRTDERWPRAGEVLTNGHYSVGLRRYHELLGPDHVHVLRQEDLRDPAVVADAFRFLGVEPIQGAPPVVTLTNRGTYDLRRLRWLRARSRLAFSWDREDVYTHRPRRWRRPVRGGVAMAIAATDRLVLRRLLGDAAADVPVSLRRALAAHYAGEISALEALLGWDLTLWRDLSEGPGLE